MIQLGVIVLYMLLLVGLGLSANRLFRGTASDYMLASHSIGPFLLLMSLFGTTMTAFALVGSTGQAYMMGAGVYGLLASASGIVHSLCFFVIGVPLWSLGRRHGYMTQIQFFRDRLESNFIGYLLFPILVLLVVGYLLVGVLGGGAVVQAVTAGTFGDVGWLASSGYGVPSWIASAVICCVVLTYVFYGGMRGTAWANAFQTSVFMILGVITFLVIARAIGGTDNLFENLAIAARQVPEIQLGRQKIPKPVFFSFLLIPLSVGMFPHVFQHWLTARSANAFKLPIIVHPIFIMIVWVPCVLLGIWASGPNAGIPPGTNKDEILGMLVQTHAGPMLAGLLTAGILAAIMSSLDSQFLCVGTMFTEDILLHDRSGARLNEQGATGFASAHVTPLQDRSGERLSELGATGFASAHVTPLHDRSGERLSEQQVVRAARCFIIGVVVLTYVLSLILPSTVFDLGLWSFTGFTGLFPLVFAAIYWRRLTAAGAIGGVLTVLVTWSILFWRSGFGSNPRYSFPEAPVDLGLVTLPPLHPVVGVFVASATAIVIISLFSRPPSEKTLAKFFRPRSGHQ